MSKKLNHFERMSHLMDSIGITEPTKTSFQFGAEAEQERIIKLLEDLYLKRDSDGNVLDTKHNEDLLHVIALIKGEK